jgi:hypothetical protein
MGYASKRSIAGRVAAMSPRPKPLGPSSFEQERTSRAAGERPTVRPPPNRQSGVHATEPAASWWADGLATCESEEVSADLSNDPRRER